MLNSLIKTYNKSIPRYTSYPTAPEWSSQVTQADYLAQLEATFTKEENTIALYVHLPFCKSLCNYCGCHVFIRPSEEKAEPYLKLLKKEIELVGKKYVKKPILKQLHFGGGSPSFISEEQFADIVNTIYRYFSPVDNAEIAIEADPRTVTNEKLKRYRALGFNRISFGVQDLNKNVQKAINRIQPEELISSLVHTSRELGFSSVNLDLIYGLPHQTTHSFIQTVEKIIQVSPDRIALFSYAHIPHIKKHQRKINDADLPSADEKLSIYLASRKRFIEAGYMAIGMDHFAKPNDELSVAYKQRELYRNFMGYTPENIETILGFGVSSIGKVGNSFFQNVKTLKEYENFLMHNHLPIDRGIYLSLDDRIRQQVILDLMCRFSLQKVDIELRFEISFDDYFTNELALLSPFIKDKLVTTTKETIYVTDLGRLFVRNIANVFDNYYQEKHQQNRFSKSI